MRLPPTIVIVLLYVRTRRAGCRRTVARSPTPRSPPHRRTPPPQGSSVALLRHDLLFTGISPELDEPPSAPHSVTIDLLHQGISSRRSRHSHLHDLQGLLDETPLLHSVASSSVSPARRSSAGGKFASLPPDMSVGSSCVSGARKTGRHTSTRQSGLRRTGRSLAARLSAVRVRLIKFFGEMRDSSSTWSDRDDGYTGDDDSTSENSSKSRIYENVPPFGENLPSSAYSENMSEVLRSGHEEDEYSDMEVGFDEYSVEVGLHHEESSSKNKSEVISGADNGREHHSQADPDIVSNEYKIHSVEEHCKILDMTFDSEPAAFVWYNSYAREHGFSIRKDILKRAKRGKCGKGEIRLRRYVCSRAGKRQEKLLTQEGHSRRLRPATRCNCNANLTVKRDLSRGVWVVKSFYGNHSHKSARPDEVPFLRSHRKIKPYQRAEILSLRASGMRKYMIMKHFLRRHGYGGVGFVRRDLYNLCCREKRKLIVKGDAATALGIMAARKKSDPEFFFDYQVDDEGRLKSMFWCDSQSRQDYQDFGDVVVFDSTYKMNRYAMPFIPFVGLNNHRKTTVFACALVSDETEDTYAWLLRTFLIAMCQKKPKGVITDGDAAMILAIQNVVPNVWQSLCT
ncbi:hypothetical protein QYE76_043923 [Lolium multiflorum]|uniref:Protein FAR1-RELATED SEQUENCE n=1 Tax=Lolium multiflorum TaxID=4521 RepID=A0AAD8THN3_LOLMU|nr:hypothetical protein QYE76_043923 [Lolium multiflorum]